MDLAPYQSILFADIKGGHFNETREEPAFFADLNLDQLINAVTASKKEYDLKPLFYSPLKDVDAVVYRQEVMQDLEDSTLLGIFKSFAQRMRIMREHLALAGKLYYKHEKEAWFLESVNGHIDSIVSLVHDLERSNIKSRGLMFFRDYLLGYVESGRFSALRAETKKIKAGLLAIQYELHIKGLRITVRPRRSDLDYSDEVESGFERFRQGAAKDYRTSITDRPSMNHVEAGILGMVARMNFETFDHLEAFCATNRDYLDDGVAVFDREIQFYIAYLEHIEKIKQSGLPFCYPELSRESKEIICYEAYDIVLADKLHREKTPVVGNDYLLRGAERIFIVSGPNQGGKTTFARAFGQLHYLASIGCPVPGREARLFLFDKLLTHFEKEEDIANLRGKLQDDLMRIRDVLSQATPNSIFIINEIFTSTTFQDSLWLGRQLLKRIIQLDSLCVCVTFLHELANLSEKTVSVVSMTSPHNPALRTYKILRKPADGLSYALSIAEKHGLTYELLKERLKS